MISASCQLAAKAMTKLATATQFSEQSEQMHLQLGHALMQHLLRAFPQWHPA